MRSGVIHLFHAYRWYIVKDACPKCQEEHYAENNEESEHLGTNLRTPSTIESAEAAPRLPPTHLSLWGTSIWACMKSLVVVTRSPSGGHANLLGKRREHKKEKVGKRVIRNFFSHIRHALHLFFSFFTHSNNWSLTTSKVLQLLLPQKESRSPRALALKVAVDEGRACLFKPLLLPSPTPLSLGAVRANEQARGRSLHFFFQVTRGIDTR